MKVQSINDLLARKETVLDKLNELMVFYDTNNVFTILEELHDLTHGSLTQLNTLFNYHKLLLDHFTYVDEFKQLEDAISKQTFYHTAKVNFKQFLECNTGYQCIVLNSENSNHQTVLKWLDKILFDTQQQINRKRLINLTHPKNWGFMFETAFLSTFARSYTSPMGIQLAAKLPHAVSVGYPDIPIQVNLNDDTELTLYLELKFIERTSCVNGHNVFSLTPGRQLRNKVRSNGMHLTLIMEHENGKVVARHIYDTSRFDLQIKIEAGTSNHFITQLQADNETLKQYQKRLQYKQQLRQQNNGKKTNKTTV